MTKDDILANLKTVLGAVLLAGLIRIVLFEAFEIDGPSMEPTLRHGDRVVVAKYPYGLFLPFTEDAVMTWGAPTAGEVIIIKSPQDNLDIVKRVIGEPGDTIELRDNRIYRNGKVVPHREVRECDEDRHMSQPGPCSVYEEELDGEAYETSNITLHRLMDYGPVTLGEDEVFVMGDHRDQSNDSRFFGPVPLSRVKGHAVTVYWSSYDGKVRTHRLFTAIK